MNSDEIAENLDKENAYIPGIVPGDATSKYIRNTLDRLTIVGSLSLVVLAALPIIFTMVTKLDRDITIGGTGLLIVCGVALETYKQLESSVVSRNYSTSKRRRR
jgi:preprotein translocase subunit SecY